MTWWEQTNRAARADRRRPSLMPTIEDLRVDDDEHEDQSTETARKRPGARRLRSVSRRPRRT